LERIATALGVTLVEFFQATEARTSLVVKESKRPRLESAWSKAKIEALGVQHSKIEPVLITLRPGGSSGEKPQAHKANSRTLPGHSCSSGQRSLCGGRERGGPRAWAASRACPENTMYLYTRIGGDQPAACAHESIILFTAPGSANQQRPGTMANNLISNSFRSKRSCPLAGPVVVS
jgi:hypothetical protein